MKRISLFATLSAYVLISCFHSTQSDENPTWVKNLIAKYENETVANPPQSIWRYEYNDATVYYIPEQCCDQFSVLYNAQGVVSCAPDGGLSGGGDGKCTDFFTKRKNEKLIWQDSRTR